MAQREEIQTAMVNPIPEPIPEDEGYRAIKNIHQCISVSYVSLALHHKKGLQKKLPTITTKHLVDRVSFLLRAFRIRIHSRIRRSKKSKHIRKLCAQYLTLHSKLPIRRKLINTATRTLAAAISFPAIDDNWRRSRDYLCRTKQNEEPSAWPLTPANKSNLSILFWNCNGGPDKEPKRTLLQETTRELKTDIIALVETKSTSPLTPTDFNPISFRKALTAPTAQDDRHAAGGICVGKLPSAELTGRTHSVFTGYIEAVATSFKSPNFSFTLVTGYIPPAPSQLRGAYEDEEFFRQLRPLYNHSLLFIADANTDIASWTGRGTTTIRKMLREGWELISSPAQPTYMRGRCIDLVLTRNFPYRCSVNVIPLSTNDHQGLHVTVTSPSDNNSSSSLCNRLAAIRLAKCSVDVDHPHYSIASTALQQARAPNGSVQQPNATPSLPPTLIRPIPRHITDEMPPPPAQDNDGTSNPIPHDPSLCFDTIIRAVNSFAAAEKLHPYSSPDPLFTALKLHLRLHYNLTKLIHSSRSHRRLHNVYRKMTEAACRAADLCVKIRNRTASQDAMSALETAAQSANLNAIARRIERSFRQNKAVLNIADIPAEQAAMHAQFWSDRWSQPFVLPLDRHQNIQYHMNPPPGVSPPSNFSITHHPNGSVWLPDADEVTAAIKRLSNNRAPGPSGIPVDFFKLTADFTDDLAELFGNIIQTQSTTPAFANCRLILLHKAGLVSEPKNYRPINLTETGFRIFESLLKNRLHAWSESVLHQDQYGFRANQSCMSALFRIITAMHAAIAQRTPLFMCFLDAVKAFDRVPHEAIMESFIAHGLCPASCRLLHSVISDHVSSVFNADNPAASIKILIECGVLQGGILSPLFFNIFADSILTNPSFRSMQALYADDRTVYDASSTQLQESLLLLQEWASTRNLLHDGNELLVINSPPPELHIHDKPIPVVPSAKCLGLTIWHTGKIERADLSTQTAFRTLKISSVWRQAKDRAPFSMLKGLLHRYMLPTTIYGSAFFTENVGRSLDVFMNQILRKATLSHNSTNTTLLSEFTGTIRPTIKMQQELISVLSRMLDNSSSHVREAVNTQFNLGLPFATKARKLLESFSDFPICGQPLIRRLDDILLHIEDRQETAQPPPSFPPFIPDHPSHNHFIAFTDGSTTESQSGCSTVILIGNNIITSSFPLPDIKENNAAEISAIIHLLEQIATLRSTTFPDINSGTLITDSLNTVHALLGTSLLQDSSFIACLHSIRKLVRSLRITLTVKWVKAHDEGHNSPFNEIADLWSGRSIESGIPITNTTIMQPSDIADACRPIPWHPSETPPTSLAADVSAFKTIANTAILLTEDARYRDTLQRYIHPQHINFPGTGSIIAKKATVPNAHWLLHLRRDPTAHFSEHQGLHQFNSPCPCCTSDTLPTHNHLFQECALNKLSRRDAKKFSRSRQFILSLYSPLPSHTDDSISGPDLQHFLVYLTSNSWHDITIANDIVYHTAAIFKIFHARRNSTPTPPTPNAQQAANDLSPDISDDDAPPAGPGNPVPQATYHTSREARVLILDRLEDCRTKDEFDACLTHYGKSLSLLVKWARQENRPFYKPNFHRQWLDRVEFYLTIFNLPTHQHRHKAYALWEAQDCRAFASTSSLLPTPPSEFTGTRTVHDEFPGWIPRMNKISKLLRHSLLRHTPVPISEVTRPERRARRVRGLHAAHHRRVPSPSWAFSLNWSMQTSSPLVEAWLAAPTSIEQRNLMGPAWPASWPKTSIITTRTNLDPALYKRNTLAKSKEGAPLVFLHDLIRGALASGEVTTNPPFPIITATAQAKQAQGTTQWFVPFDAAALILIYTPIEILRRQYTFTINPLSSTRNCDFPPDIIPFPPRLDTFHRMQDRRMLDLPQIDAICAAHEWALDQLSHGRKYPSTEFPATPADIPGPPTDSESDAESNSDFDGIISTSSEDDTSDSNDEQPLPRPSPSAHNPRRLTPAQTRSQQPHHQTGNPQDRPPLPTPTSKRRRTNRSP